MVGVGLVDDVPEKTWSELSKSSRYLGITSLGAAVIKVHEVQLVRRKQGKPMQGVPDERAHGASSDGPRSRHNVASYMERVD
jgi:hypothetical protein